MATVIPHVTNWSVTPQNGNEDYFTKMNVWLSESTAVIASLNGSIDAINQAIDISILQNGAIDNNNIAINRTFSNLFITNNYYKKTEVDDKFNNTRSKAIGDFDAQYVARDYHIVAFGGEFNRADYPLLWAWVQANPSLVKTQTQWQTEATANGGICGFYSSGNGTTTFRVPNLDKAFLRPDNRGVGSYQSDEFKSHSHNISGVSSANAGTVNVRTTDSATTTGVSTSYTGSTETRPKNIAVLPLIIAK